MRECASEIITHYRPEEEKSGLGFYSKVLAGTLSSAPYIAQKYRCADIKDYQRRFYEKSPGDAVILCDFLEMTENVDWKTSAPRILFQHNVESMIWRRYFETESNPLKKAYFNYEQKRIAEYEKNSCNKFDLVLVVSENDKQLLQSEFKVTTPIEVIETGVDTEFFRPDDSITPKLGRLVFLGSMDWMPNIDGVKWFADEIYPRIREVNSGATLEIVGRRPGPEIQALAEKDESIAIHADVPDVRPFIAGADLFIVPLRVGGGTRIKIFEAMGMRSPVVSTSVGAEGLPVTAGRDIALGDTPEEFAAQVNKLLQTSDIRNSIAEEGFNLVRERYQWKAIAGKFHQLCQNQLERKRSSQGALSR